MRPVVRVEEDERGQRGGADRVALRHGLRRVADRVERIGDRAHAFRQVRHLCDPAGVVCDRAICIERDDQAGHRELRHHGDADSVQAGKVVRDEDAGGEHDHRQRGCLHADGEPFDDVRRVAGLRRLRDRLDRVPPGAGVELGDRDEQERHDQADDRRQVEVLEVVLAAVEGHRDRDEADRRQHGRHDHGLVERVDDRVRATAEAREERADHRRDGRDRAEHERVEVHARVGEARDGAEQHHCDRGDGIGLEQVGRHAGAVADVVADVVSDHGRVARVVLGDAGLDLADEVGADVGGLREDAAAEPGEDGDERATEREADQVVDRRVRRVVEPGRQEPVVAGDAEQAEADDEQARDRPGAERDVQRRLEALAGRLGGARVRAHGHVHPDEAGGGGQRRLRSGSRTPCPNRACCRRRAGGTARSRRSRSPCTASSGRPQRPPGRRARSPASSRSRPAA